METFVYNTDSTIVGMFNTVSNLLICICDTNNNIMYMFGPEENITINDLYEYSNGMEDLQKIDTWFENYISSKCTDVNIKHYTTWSDILKDGFTGQHPLFVYIYEAIMSLPYIIAMKV